ncbi:MAG TPA: hypothetical protein VE093_03270 [Polyangiaceae bacterium]|nr:hypothetical protein [Polyangiaceae bacterium]
MVGRLSAGALSAGIALLALHGVARGEDPGPADRAPAAAAAAAAAAKGAVVVAVGEGATEAARPLAHDVYRDEALRPAIDDATARVLIGEPLPNEAPPKLAELAEIRASIARSGSDAAARRLLASIGEGARARVVVTVAMEGGRPVAKVLRVETRAFESVELGATVETPAAPPAEGQAAKIVRWPGAVATLRASAAPAGSASPSTGAGETSTSAPTSAAAAPEKDKTKAASAGPVRPTPKSAPKPAAPPKPVEDRPTWQSPWFWVTLGGVAVAGFAAFGIAKAVEADEGLLRLQGRVAP